VSPTQLIAHLNSMSVGAVAGQRTKLEQARLACVELEQAELAEKLVEAGQALEAADLKTFRKRLETVVARLGHLR
jgi:hypothetical protein